MKQKYKRAMVTVTELEMTVPPLVRAQPPHWAKPAILKAENIPLSYYRYLYDQVGRPYHWAIRTNMDDASLGREIHSENVEIYVLYLKGAPAGFYELQRSSKDAHYLIYFGLMRTWHGMGVGKFFLSHAIDTLWSAEPKTNRRGTCTLDHPAALGLYQKAGFKPVAQWKKEREVFADVPLPNNL